MNKKLIVACMGAVAWMASGIAVAAELKVGYVDVTKVLDPQAKAIMQKLEKEFGAKQKQLIATQKELRDAEENLTRDAAIMSDSEREKAEKDLFNRKRDFRRSQDEFKEDINVRKNEELGKLQKAALDATAEIAKAEGYDLVVSDGVMFASERIDMTDKLLKKLKVEAKPK